MLEIEFKQQLKLEFEKKSERKPGEGIDSIQELNSCLNLEKVKRQYYTRNSDLETDKSFIIIPALFGL